MTATYLDNAGARMRREISDFASAKRAYIELSRGGDKLAKLGNNTWIDLRREQGVEPSREYVVIILHNTGIVDYYDDGMIVLNSGGYQTVTTKARMNEVLPPGVHIDQVKREWFVTTPEGRQKFYDHMELFKKRPGRFDTPLSDVPRRNPGKFDNIIEWILYHNVEDETGSSAEDRWFGLVTGMTKPEAREIARDEIETTGYNEFGESFDSAAEQYDWPIHAVVEEDTQGFVTVYTYKTKAQVMKVWKKVQRDFP